VMFPTELIRARKRKGTIRLTYASDDILSLAKTLVSVYKEHVGKTRGELNDALSGCEELGYNYKLVRGISTVLEERCIFQSRAVTPPMDTRRALFEEAAGVVATKEDRKRVLSTVAFRMGVSASDLDKSLYADLYDEQELSKFEVIRPMCLLKEYNFALTLALLAHAKRLELIYRVKDEEIEELGFKIGKCEVSNISDISKMVVSWRPTRRIGYKAQHLEDLLTHVMSKGVWELAADIIYPLDSKKSHRFEISHRLEGRLLKPSRRELNLEAKGKSKHELQTQPRGEIIDVQEMAMRLGITEAKVRERYDGYVDLGSILITRDKLVEVEEALEGASDMRFETVHQNLKNVGCRDPLPMLEVLGYVVDWTKDRGKSRVYRLRSRKTP
jgi:hypothetical protein